jgi:hypothetical protein
MAGQGLCRLLRAGDGVELLKDQRLAPEKLLELGVEAIAWGALAGVISIPRIKREDRSGRRNHELTPDFVVVL